MAHCERRIGTCGFAVIRSIKGLSAGYLQLSTHRNRSSRSIEVIAQHSAARQYILPHWPGRTLPVHVWDYDARESRKARLTPERQHDEIAQCRTERGYMSSQRWYIEGCIIRETPRRNRVLIS